ncbi:MAG TPA: SMI1/KNR4 family protein [Chitinophaga sp.]|uniref:SMI1/KNR4 family protein n=1 Tax=Chitinophaga sp. TaxID=1869181 RepID=UPI002BD2F01B|nr:SMI1/KNR4 family protein [Chitinophaga sp.]HVI47653.1 SMI1/KNR4 family protein [Chitinophaga sp.]
MDSNNDIENIEKALGVKLPGAYTAFLLEQQLKTSRLFTDLILLYGTDELEEQNKLYEVQHYLPAYLTIGDDSGGQAILLHTTGEDQTVYITGHGALDEGSMAVLSNDFISWVRGGYSADIIRESPDVTAFQSSETFQLRKEYYALHRTIKQLEEEKQQGLDLKTYILRKRVLHQQIQEFETLHAGKNYRY